MTVTHAMAATDWVSGLGIRCGDVMFSAKAASGNATISMLGANVGINTGNPQASLDVGGLLQSVSLSIPGTCNVGTLTTTGNLVVGGTLALANLALSNVNCNILTANGLSLPYAPTFTGNAADLASPVLGAVYIAQSQGAAPTASVNTKVYVGTATTSSGTATFYPTLNGLANGRAIFSNIAGVQASVVVNTAAANTVCYTGVRSISSNTVVVNAVSPSGTVTTAAVGGAKTYSIGPAPDGSPVNVTIMGT